MCHLEILVSKLKPSVIALSGTWFKSENDDELFSLEGYHQPFTSTRTQKRGGEVAKNVTLHLEAELFNSDEYRESVSVKIMIPKTNRKSLLIVLFLLQNTRVSCFYCGSSRNKNTYVEHVEEALDKNSNGLQIVCGDFNTDVLKENLGARVTFENMMNSK